MPFTLAHPAASIPLAKRGFNLSALIVGSLVPDLGYYLTLQTNQAFPHSLLGLFLYDLPVGYLVLCAFHFLLKRPLLALLSDNHQRRLGRYAGPYPIFPLRRFLSVGLSLLIGSSTHLIWDSFTHVEGWVVQHVPFFFTVVFSFGGSYFQVFKVLQYLSSILGVAVLIAWYLKWYRETQPQPDFTPSPMSEWKRGLILAGMVSLAVGIAVIAAFLNVTEIESLQALKDFVVRGLVTMISSLGVELVLFACVWQGLQRKIIPAQ